MTFLSKRIILIAFLICIAKLEEGTQSQFMYSVSSKYSNPNT